MSVTREHMALFLMRRMAGLRWVSRCQSTILDDSGFTDTGDLSRRVADAAIGQLADLGITKGTSDYHVFACCQREAWADGVVHRSVDEQDDSVRLMGKSV